MNPGDLVRLNNQGQSVRVIPQNNLSPLTNSREFLPGTLALILAVEFLGKEGPCMETYAKIIVGGDFIGYVWLYECEAIRDNE